MKKKILFLCTGNSCRSIMAEVLLNELGSDCFRAYSAGSFPTGQVNTDSLKILENKKLNTVGLKSQSWNDFFHINFDIVITVCDNAAYETCPVYLGRAIKGHWGIADPDKVVGKDRPAAFEMAFNQLENRILKLLKLPSINNDSLNNIGNTTI